MLTIVIIGFAWFWIHCLLQDYETDGDLPTPGLVILWISRLFMIVVVLILPLVFVGWVVSGILQAIF
jgi:hypothetical protein